MTTNLIKYNELVAIEGGIHVQGGMNFEIRGSYSIVLMSTEKTPRMSMRFSTKE